MSNVRVRLVLDQPKTLEGLRALNDPESRMVVVRDIMEGARDKLIQVASQQLHSTRADYINGIQPLEVEGHQVVLTLSGPLTVMIENGWDGRMLHETLFGPGANQRLIYTNEKGQRYRYIPFRHKTPGAGSQGGAPMGSPYTPPGARSRAAPRRVVDDAGKLGRRIHRAAKKLKAGESLPAGMAPRLRDHHSTDIYAGMRARLQPVSDGRGGVAHQRTYETFRTISEGRMDKWYHPGIEARHFLREVERYIERVGPQAVEAFLQSQIGGGHA